MNLQEISNILKTEGAPDDLKEKMILEVIAKDKKVLPYICTLLHEERNNNRERINNLNNLLGKADCALSCPELNADGFIQKEVKDFYTENKDIKHSFKRYENEELEGDEEPDKEDGESDTPFESFASVDDISALIEVLDKSMDIRYPHEAESLQQLIDYLYSGDLPDEGHSYQLDCFLRDPKEFFKSWNVTLHNHATA